MSMKESARRFLKDMIPAKLRYDIKLKRNSGTMSQIEALDRQLYEATGKVVASQEATGQNATGQEAVGEKTNSKKGINLVGPILSATGLGQSFRLLEGVFADTDIPYTIIPFEGSRDHFESDEKYKDKIGDSIKYDITLWHVNPAEFVDAYRRFGREAFDKHYNIAFWLWEIEEFPEEWIPVINLLDEIWTPAEFISRTLRKVTDKPVYTVPYAVTAEADTKNFGRKYFNLPEDKFLFLMMYDTNSIMERKNPQGVIEAYKKAFYSEEAKRVDGGKSSEQVELVRNENKDAYERNVKAGKPALVIKVNSASSADWKKINRLLDGIDKDNVYLVDGNLTKLQVNSLIAEADAFVSLHRAEGFGLVMAEAMLNHTACIATDYSANTEFMNGRVAYMIGYEMQTLTHIIPPYHKGIKWADPDVDQAAEAMKELYSDWLEEQTAGKDVEKCAIEGGDQHKSEHANKNAGSYSKLTDDAYDFVTEVLGAERVKGLLMERLSSI